MYYDEAANDTFTALVSAQSLGALVIVGLVCGIAGAVLADHKGQTPWKWFVVCGVFGLLGLAALACTPRRSRG